MQKRHYNFLSITMMISSVFLIASCTHYIETTVTVKPGFSSYNKIALLWQNGGTDIYETFFLANWMDAFPNQTLVERKEITKVIREQDLLPGRLNRTTRARLREVFGVKALILVIFHKQDKSYVLRSDVVDLSIKVVDTETGEVTVSAVSQGRDRSIDSKIVEAIRLIESKTRYVP